MGERFLAIALKEFSLEPSTAKQRGAVETLLRLVNNIQAHPDDPKYQQVRLENDYLTRTLLDIRGSRTALRGIGFTIDENHEFYKYNGQPLDTCAGFLQAFHGELVRKAADDAAKGKVQNDGGSTPDGSNQPGDNPRGFGIQVGQGRSDSSKAYKRRTGPTNSDGFKRFKDGVEGLKARWAELEFVLRSPITCESTLVESQTKVEAASKFLADLESTAEEVDLLQGIILQSIVGDGQGHGGEGSALVGKIDSARVEQLKSGSAALRTLLRLKISDDADLDTARRSVMDMNDFFRLLASHADAEGTSAYDMLRALAI
eukprot:g3564.t1